MKITGKTDIGCNRAENQDTFRSEKISEVSWGIVCDGMGGGRHGRLASTVAADCIGESLHRQLTEEPDKATEDMLWSAIELSNAEVFARSGSGEEMMGTTVVCVVAKEGALHFAHVGDSRAYLFEDGKLRQITRDHSMVQELVDQGIITQEEAAHHPEKNVITRALGVEESVRPSFSKEEMLADSTVLLCSDGLTNMVSEEDIAEILTKVNFWDLPRELVNAALAAGGDDNITVLLLRVEAGDVLK